MSTETMTVPRVRWAAVIWGTTFAAIAAGALWFLTDAERRAALADVGTMTPATLLTIVLLTAGALFLVGGVAGLVRRTQRNSPAEDSEDAE